MLRKYRLGQKNGFPIKKRVVLCHICLIWGRGGSAGGRGASKKGGGSGKKKKKIQGLPKFKGGPKDIFSKGHLRFRGGN